MNEADRIAKMHQQAREREAKEIAASARRKLIAEQKALTERIRALKPRVLAVLREQGYPNPALVRVKRWWGTQERAGWPVASAQSGNNDTWSGITIHHCYLLSTGELYYGGGMGYSPEEIEQGLLRLLNYSE